jgi:hypothetical protein
MLHDYTSSSSPPDIFPPRLSSLALARDTGAGYNPVCCLLYRTRSLRVRSLLIHSGLALLMVGIAAVAWLAQHDAGQSVAPSSTGDWVGLLYVILLVAVFLIALIWYFLRGGRP